MRCILSNRLSSVIKPNQTMALAKGGFNEDDCYRDFFGIRSHNGMGRRGWSGCHKLLADNSASGCKRDKWDGSHRVLSHELDFSEFSDIHGSYQLQQLGWGVIFGTGCPEDE